MKAATGTLYVNDTTLHWCFAASKESLTRGAVAPTHKFHLLHAVLRMYHVECTSEKYTPKLQRSTSTISCCTRDSLGMLYVTWERTTRSSCRLLRVSVRLEIVVYTTQLGHDRVRSLSNTGISRASMGEHVHEDIGESKKSGSSVQISRRSVVALSKTLVPCPLEVSILPLMRFRESNVVKG